MLNELQNRFRKLDKNTRIGIILVLIATFTAFMFDFTKVEGPEKNVISSETSAEIDTFIPSGFSLVPIEVINSNGLDSILGRFGMVDLYLENKKIAVMKNVRLVRGIRTDGTWAVLVPTQFVQNLLEVGGRFYVSVRSRNTDSSEIVKKMTIKKRSIEYDQ